MKNKRYFEFGKFQLDVRERALLRNGEAVQLTPKAFDTLVILVENAGSLVEKDQIMRAVWPDSFVEEIGLARNISVLRKALGEDSGEQQFIETVPKAGYRFTAEVREHVEAQAGSAAILPAGVQRNADGAEAGNDLPRAAELVFEQSSLSQTVEIFREYSTGDDRAIASSRSVGVIARDRSASPGPVVARPLPVWKSKRAVIVFAISLIALSAVLYSLLANRIGPPDKSRIRSIAVLPFKRLDTADDNERLGIGIADTLITRLSNIRELSIRPTRDVMKYEDAAGDIAAAAKALDVDAILDGSIQRGGDRLRVTVRLIHTESKSQIWAAQFDEKLTDIFTMQDAISAQVAHSLSLNLSDAEQQRIRKNYTQNVEAYQAYLKARYFWNRRSREDLDKTIEHLETAISISPDYALAYTGLADAYSTLAYMSRTASRREHHYQLARKAAAKAIEIDENLAEAQASLGIILRSSDWGWVESEKALKRAIELNPGYPIAHHYYALLLATVGRLDEAVTEVTTAQRLDPLSLAINADMGLIYIFSRKPEHAIEVVTRALEMDPQFTRLQRISMFAHLQAGRLEEAIKEAQSTPAEGPESIFQMSITGCAHAAGGRRENAVQMVEKLLTLTDQYSPALVQAAAVCSVLDDKDRAFELLGKAVDVRDDRLLWIKVDPRFDNLRADDRYQRLLSRMNLPR